MWFGQFAFWVCNFGRPDTGTPYFRNSGIIQKKYLRISGLHKKLFSIQIEQKSNHLKNIHKSIFNNCTGKILINNLLHRFELFIYLIFYYLYFVINYLVVRKKNCNLYI